MVKVQDYETFIIYFISPLVKEYKSKVQDELARNETKRWYLKLSRVNLHYLQYQIGELNREQKLVTIELKRCKYSRENNLEFIVPDSSFKTSFYNWWSKGKPCS